MNRGKIYVVGIGPGALEYMTIKAKNSIEKSNVVVGYKTYIDLLANIISTKKIIVSGMKKEKERCLEAINYAEKGNIVSLISSGDPGIYAMAGITLELIEKTGKKVEVEIVPGVTAANAAAACVGAPIMHDSVNISLSDLLTPWETIENRLECAGKGDFVVCLYNPKSNKRQMQIQRASEIMLNYKDKNTPVAIVKNATREGEEVLITTLGEMPLDRIDMFTTVIIGNSKTYTTNQKMITPRGYEI